MTTDRLDEIIKATAYPESMSVYQAVYQVENEMQQEFNSRTCKNCKHRINKTNCEKLPYYIWNEHTLEHDTLYLEVHKDFGCLKFERKNK